MTDPTPVEMDDKTLHVRTTSPPVGDLLLETDRGTVHAVEAPGFMTTRIEREGLATVIGLIVYNPDFRPAGDDVGLGMVTQLSPASARTIAHGLMMAADAIEEDTKQ